MRLLKGKYPDVPVTGTSRSAEKRQRLLEEGFDYVVLDQIREAHMYLESSKSFGKVVILP